MRSSKGTNYKDSNYNLAITDVIFAWLEEKYDACFEVAVAEIVGIWPCECPALGSEKYRASTAISPRKGTPKTDRL
ncbi:hypothetical protein PJI17_31745, partial [Mycobacterium kansasii]